MNPHIKFGGYDPIDDVLPSGGGMRWIRTVDSTTWDLKTGSIKVAGGEYKPPVSTVMAATLHLELPFIYVPAAAFTSLSGYMKSKIPTLDCSDGVTCSFSC